MLHHSQPVKGPLTRSLFYLLRAKARRPLLFCAANLFASVSFLFGCLSMAGICKEYVLDVALVVAPGDVAQIEGDKIRVYHNGNVIAERNLANGKTLTETPWATERVFKSVYVVEEGPKMPGVIATMTDVVVNEGTGAIRFDFSDGTQREFSNRADALDSVQYLDTDVATVQDAAILKSLRNSPDGANLANFVGGTVAFDYSSVQPMLINSPAVVGGI